MPEKPDYGGFGTCKTPSTLFPSFPIVARWPSRTTRFPFEVRQLLYGRKPHAYRILFTITANTVVILHIRHARQRPVA
jgi:hypothetical protein